MPTVSHGARLTAYKSSFIPFSIAGHTNSTTHLSQNYEDPPDPFWIKEPGYKIKFSNYHGRRILCEQLREITGELFAILDKYEEEQHLDPDDPLPDMSLTFRTEKGVEFDLYPTFAKTSPLKIEDAREVLDAIAVFNEKYNVGTDGLQGFDIEYTELLPDLGFQTLGRGTVRRVNPRPAPSTIQSS